MPDRVSSPRPLATSGALLVACLAACVAGCVQTSVTRLGEASYPPTTPEAVTIYLEEADIPGPYEKIALIQAQGESNWTSTEQMLDKVREDAAAVGATGVLIEGVDEPSAGAKVAGAFLGTGAQRTGRMIAIRVHPDSTAAQPDTTAARVELRPGPLAPHALRGPNR